MKAIAAMSLNGVIGRGNTIPWHLPEDFKWFKRATMGGALVMGRKTFLSLGKPLPGRRNVVLSRDPASLASDPAYTRYLEAPQGNGATLEFVAELPDLPENTWLAGGAQLYGQFLSACSDLYLTVVFRDVEGDAFFPPFEHLFSPEYSVELKTEDFEVRHYRRLSETTL